MSSAVLAPIDTQSRDALVQDLTSVAARLRIDILDMIYQAASGHPGSSFSCLEILLALWSGVMQHNPGQPNWVERDRFVMSKGHGAPALYAVLMEHGYIPREELNTLRQVNSNLQGHPASKYVEGVDVSTGSLGQGLSCGVGMVLGHRLDQTDAWVYVLMGDGECQEGNVWEAVMSAAHHKAGRLIAFVDRNKLQIDGDTEQVKALGDMEPKFQSFGWNVLSVEEGHDFNALLDAIADAKRLGEETGQPTVIVTYTTKGKGVSFMENEAGWHGKAPNADEYAAAREELTAALAAFQ